MAHPLIGIHAFLGELGIATFIWVFVELLNPTPQRIKRAKIASIIGVLFFLLSWIAGGYYYLNIYGSNVKPLIKEGPQPWAHAIFTETKEHVFLFLPFLAILASSLIFKSGKTISTNKKTRNAILILCIVIIAIGILMGAMGYLISTGARAALEAKAG